MKLTTPVDLSKSDFTIDHASCGVIVGSCFAQNIGGKLTENKFKVVVNPCGAAYNPLSVIGCFELITGRREFTRESLVKHSDQWISFAHNTLFSSADKDLAYSTMSESLRTASEAFQRADYVIITLGTAWVYRLKATCEVVNNCHKLPDREFERRMLSVQEIVQAMSEMFSWPEFQDKRIILTVSPVRHLKDTLHGNQISKSTLMIAVDTLTKTFGNTTYFPAYEIVIDELRDYRFYADDMVHPSATAVNYIWERFCDWTIDPQSTHVMSKIAKISAAMNHRPLDASSETYKKFRSKTKHDIEQIMAQYSDIDLNSELKFFTEK